MEYDSIINLCFAMLFIVSGTIVYIYDYINYPIKVKGECLEADWGRWANSGRFKYIIDGVEYIGSGPCGAYPKRVGKYYTVWVNKDDHERYTMTSMKTCTLLIGIFLL